MCQVTAPLNSDQKNYKRRLDHQIEDRQEQRKQGCFDVVITNKRSLDGAITNHVGEIILVHLGHLPIIMAVGNIGFKQLIML